MSERHTPGPWAVEKTDGYVVCELTAGWCVVATEADPNKYSPEADARLIASAPELLEALQKCSHVLPLSEEYDLAISVIAKATGE